MGKKRSALDAVWAVVVLLAVGWFLAGLAGIGAGVASLLVTIGFCYYCKWKIGGVTGDTIGATSEIAEVVMAIVMCAWLV